MKNVTKIKALIKKECETLDITPKWFFEEHLILVEKNALWLLNKIDNVDKEVVLLGVWLHDMQWVRGIDGEHETIGAVEGEKIMRKFGYDKEMINKVQKIILTHSCEGKMPNSVEGKVLATADAMAHYTGDFFLRIATLGDRSLKDYKKWALEKIDRNYNKKIFFDFAREKIKKRHKIIKSFITNEI